MRRFPPTPSGSKRHSHSFLQQTYSFIQRIILQDFPGVVLLLLLYLYVYESFCFITENGHWTCHYVHVALLFYKCDGQTIGTAYINIVQSSKGFLTWRQIYFEPFLILEHYVTSHNIYLDHYQESSFTLYHNMRFNIKNI